MGDDAAANDHLTGYALVMSENFRAKNREINDLKEILLVGKRQKREILENLEKEVGFKVNLRAEAN